MVLSLIRQISASEIEDLHNVALEICIKYGRRLIVDGDLQFLSEILAKEKLSGRLLPRLLETLDNSLTFDLTGEKRPQWLDPDYVERVRKWRVELIPSDLHGRLLTTVGVDPWHHALGVQEERWKGVVRELVAELHADPAALVTELDWLLSDEARSAAVLGAELGWLDSGADHLNAIMSAVVQPGKHLMLPKAYLANLIAVHPEYANSINLALDRIGDNSEVAYELALACGRPAKSLRRTLDQIRAGRLTASHLQGFITGYRPDDPLTSEELAEVLRVLLEAVNAGHESSARVAVHLIGYGVTHAPDRGSVVDMMFELLARTANDGGGESYWWARSVEALAAADPVRSSRVASLGLCGEYFQREESQKVLIELARTHPEEVMREVGTVMLDESSGMQVFVGDYRELFSSLPFDVVARWLLQSASVEGARKIARHLVSPYISSAGDLIVPKLTEFVLETFEDDDLTFAEFRAGTSSSRGLVGNFAAQLNAEAEMAKPFLSHHLRRIREWAAFRIESAKRHAEQWRQFQEERDVD